MGLQGCSAAGQCVGRPTRNVLWIDTEVRNGHGLTLGSDAAGGVINVTYKNIFLNGMGGPQAVGKRHPPGAIGGPHFKTQRGRGGTATSTPFPTLFRVFLSSAPPPPHAPCADVYLVPTLIDIRC